MASKLVLPHPRPPSFRRGVSAPLETRLSRNLKTALLEGADRLTEKKRQEKENQMLRALSDCYKIVMVKLHCQSPWKHILGVCEGEPSIGLGYQTE